MQQDIRASEDRWAQLYVFAKLLAERKLCYGDAFTEQSASTPIVGVERTDKVRGTILYDCASDERYVLVYNDTTLIAKADRTMIDGLLARFLSEIKHGSGGAFGCPSGQEIMDMLLCAGVTAEHEEDDIHIVFYNGETRIAGGFVIRSLIGSDPLLLGGSPETNIIFCGERPHTPTWSARVGVVRIIRELFGTMRELYGRFSYTGMQGTWFNHNMLRINPHLPNVIGSMVLHYYQHHTKSVRRIVRRIIQEGEIQQQFNISDSNIEKMVKEFLVALAFGMRADRQWQSARAISRGYLVLRQDGEVFAYDSYNGTQLEDWLYSHTILETVDRTDADFGVPFEGTMGKQCIKLNLQIRLRQ